MNGVTSCIKNKNEWENELSVHARIVNKHTTWDNYTVDWLRPNWLAELDGLVDQVLC